MSDYSSVPLSSSTAKPSGTEIQLVNPNLILQKVLQQISSEQRNVIALRCEELPFVFGNEEDWQSVFTQLLKTIFNKPKPVKLFLHIQCTSENKKAAEATSGMNEKLFTIQFNTNLKPSADWLQNNEQHIHEAAAILQKNDGHLTVNQTQKPGCIFSLTLPGKHL